MHRRDLASLAALAITALTLGVGCPEEQQPAPSTGAPAGTAKPAQTGTAKPTGASTGAATGAPAGGAATGAPAGGAAAMGTATIKGVVNFTGTAPEMKVPAKRKDAEICKNKEVKYNAVLVSGGKLQDVFVRIAPGQIKGDFKPPTTKAAIDQVDCMYSPRIQGVVSGQEIEIRNSDQTLHNVHTFKGAETWFNQAQPKGAAPLSKEIENEEIIKFTCDVHPWMRGFVVVSAHPFFAVSKADGTFQIDKVPAGKYELEAWHPMYGSKKATVEVADGKTVETTFSYDGKEPAPAENKEELKGLW